jgi:NADP-dependent 3-hydroxy acid dehydrogenase YdfG
MSKPLIVVTGASHGIGRAAAAAFAAEQHPLLLVSRHPVPLDGLPSEQIMSAAVDVSDYAALEAAVHTAEARHGPTECLVNCAGFLRIGALETRGPTDMSYEVDVLLKGVLNGIRVVLGNMKARNSGTIINVSSIGDRVPGPDGEVYHACKAALHSLEGSLQKGQAENNIRVMNVAPGFVRTNIHPDLRRESRPSGREGTRSLGCSDLHVRAGVSAARCTGGRWTAVRRRRTPRSRTATRSGRA